MGKKGQFYFVATLIIILILSGLVYVYTSIGGPKEYFNAQDLADEIKFETSQLIDKLTLEDNNFDQISESVKSIILVYYEGKYKGSTILVIYGNTTEINIISSTSILRKTPELDNGKKVVKIDIYGSEHVLEIKEERMNLYSIVAKETNGEKSVAIR